MRDRVTQARVAALHPKIAAEVETTIDRIELCFPKNMFLRIAQGFRTMQEQADLYEQGRSKSGKKVTNAKAGQSYHNYGLAVDFVIIESGKAIWNHKYNSLVVQEFKAAGFVWGGDFKSIKDKPHFEKTFGYHWSQLLQRHKDKVFISGTQFVSL